MYADENVIKIKHDVLFEVAKLAFAGELEEQRDHLPLKLIPGPTPQFRYCIYKEREIIRQRIRLAEGKAPGPEDDGNIIQVISSACENCPISSYTVTENCQNCLGKACINACKFGAIEPGHYRSHIDASKCKECGQCAKACPYNAIAHLKRPCKFSCPVDAITYDEHGISIIDKNKCIRCGKCVSACPMGLEPYYLSKMTQKKGWDELEALMITSCIECGCCQSTCPAYLPLLDWVRLGKQTVMGLIRARAAAAPKK